MSEDSEKRLHRRRVREWWQTVDRSLPSEVTPLEAIVCMKALDADGEVCLIVKKTSGLSPWEAFGILSYALDDYSSATINAGFTEDED